MNPSIYETTALKDSTHPQHPQATYDPELSDKTTAGFSDEHGEQYHILRKDLPKDHPARTQGLTEQQAEYDYGHCDSQDEQTHFDMDDYVWKGRADFPERVTSARFGSNAMANELKESIHERLQAAYAAYVAESDDSLSDPNREGRLSPLTANSRQKFDKDPAEGEPDVTGQDSPMTTIVRQHIPR